jgi:hypothetical protein
LTEIVTRGLELEVVWAKAVVNVNCKHENVGVMVGESVLVGVRVTVGESEAVGVLVLVPVSVGVGVGFMILKRTTAVAVRPSGV